MKAAQKELLALGALGAGLLLLAKSSAKRGSVPAPPPGPPQPKPTPTTPPGPPVGPVVPPAPPPPAPPTQPLGPVSTDGSRALLVQGGRYRAEVDAGALSFLATEGAVQRRLENIGFRSVAVRSLGGGKYRAAGTWPRPSGSFPVPDQISRLERIA